MHSTPYRTLLYGKKLFCMGASAKIIRIVKALYEQATVRLTSGNTLSEEFEITEGILQGETLSTLLFVLYISDFESFFRARGHRGLNIDGINDLLMLLYADGTVILAHSHIELVKLLQTLEEYCTANGLTVNVTKTKIVIFKSNGRTKKINPSHTKCKASCIEIVPSYNDLEIPVSTSSMGLAAVKSAIHKAKMTSGTTISILARAKCDAWAAYVKLYNSMVSSTLLYAFPAWGIRYRDYLELAQADFFRRLLYLPRGTPNWALRLEFGLVKVSHTAIHLAWNYHIRVLKMRNSCLPRICLNRAFQLADRRPDESKYNWAAQFRAFLIAADALDLSCNTEPNAWVRRTEQVFSSYEISLKLLDWERGMRSGACQLRILRELRGGAAGFVRFRLPIPARRLLVQLRLATNHM